MGRVARWTLLWVLSVGPGCAYRSAMSRGEAAANAGDWSTAVTEYRTAFSTKQTEEARTALNDARANAIDQSVSIAEQALLLREYDKAYEQLQYVRSASEPDEPRLPDLIGKIRSAVEGDVQRRVAQGDSQSAYDLALSVAKMDLDDPIFSVKVVETVRDDVLAKAREQLAAGDPEAALATLEVIAKAEPDRKELVALPMHEARVAWADQLIETAQKHWRNGRRGASALYYARAYEVGGRPEELQSARQIALGLVPETQLKYYMKLEGESWTRKKYLRDEVRAALAAMENVARGGETTSTLLITLDVLEARCTESKVSTPKSVDYVSGQIDVPAPDFVALEERMAVAQAAHDKAQDAVDKLTPDLNKANQTLAQLDRDLDQLKGELSPAKKSLERAKEQLATQEALVAKLEKDLEAATPEERPTVQTKLSVIANNVLDWKQAVQKWQTTHDEAAAKVAQLESDRGPSVDAAKRLQDAMDVVSAEQKRARKDMTEIKAEMTRTPRTMKEDVTSTFTYTQVDWTRDCSAPVRAYSWTKWKTAVDKKLRLDPELVSTDAVHPGLSAAKVANDPKDYGTTTQEQIRLGDEKNAKDLVAWATSMAREHFAVQVQETLARMDTIPYGASDEMISLYLGGPSYLDEAALKAFQDHARKHYGLEKLSFLKPDLTAE